MPEISRFFGIVIAMYYNDHEPPHFHARYGGQRGRFAIDDGRMMDGNLSPRVRGLVVEWIASNRAALQRDWQLARAQQPLQPVPPLE